MGSAPSGDTPAHRRPGLAGCTAGGPRAKRKASAGGERYQERVLLDGSVQTDFAKSKNETDIMTPTQDRHQANRIANTDQAIEAAERRCVEDGRRIIRSTTRLLGQPVVLVPMHSRAKTPRLRKFQTFTLDLMQNEQFIACLGRPNCNVAVLLGKASGGLCTFDFDDDQDAELFLELNESFQETLMTTARRGRNLWFFVDGEYPGSFDVRDDDGHNCVEFRANGRLTMIYGTHPCGYSYRLLHRARPVTCEWKDIKWPLEWQEQLPRANAPRDIVERLRCVADEEYPQSLRLDFAKLSNLRPRADGSYNARCPACAEQGRDTAGNHVIIFPNGSFACVIFPHSVKGSTKHRATIRQLAGVEG